MYTVKKKRNNINNYKYRNCELKSIAKHKRTEFTNNNYKAIFKNIFYNMISKRKCD